MPTRKIRPSVSIIGAGRLGSALALALSASGYPVVALVTRLGRKGQQLLRLLPKTNPRPLVLSGGHLKRLPSSDLILICTPDDAIEAVARELSKHPFERRSAVTVLHTSGALSSKELAPLAVAGFHTGSLHPLVSVSEPRVGAKALRGAFYCLEGDTTARRVARALIADLDGKSFSIRPESKALYHAAAVLASPHLVALFDIAVETLAACGLSRDNARKVLLPLVESTVDNLKISDAAKALTGTFARGDSATVARHLDALSGKNQAEALEVYRLLGLHSLKLARKRKLNSQQIEEIRKLLMRT